MKNKKKGVVIAAVKSGSGKTLITCALIQALKNRDMAVCSYKCGPDYIDPMFHRTILGTTGGNLDTFFTGEEKTRESFDKNTPDDAFSVVEGVMGLYDGMGGISEEGSTYHLAKTLSLPIILVIDAHGMGRSILPLISGFLAYDTAKQICGVILNRVSKGYFPRIAELIRKELAIEVFGYFEQDKKLQLESRHLGLKMPEEIASLKEQVQNASKALEQSVDIDRILTAADSWETKQVHERSSIKQSIPTVITDKKRPVLALARDEAFCFYYRENLRLLKDAGFQIKEFSPLHDRKLPDNSSALLLGGGYPELYALPLSKNESMKQSIRENIQSGMPSVAECGGFMYLHKYLVNEQKEIFDMAGVIDGECTWKGKLVRFGYVLVQEKENTFLADGGLIKGHEFHYYDSSANGDSCIAKKASGTQSFECIWKDKKHWWGFPHLYYPSNPTFVEHFYQEALDYKKES